MKSILLFPEDLNYGKLLECDGDYALMRFYYLVFVCWQLTKECHYVPLCLTYKTSHSPKYTQKQPFHDAQKKLTEYDNHN